MLRIKRKMLIHLRRLDDAYYSVYTTEGETVIWRELTTKKYKDFPSTDYTMIDKFLNENCDTHRLTKAIELMRFHHDKMQQ